MKHSPPLPAVGSNWYTAFAVMLVLGLLCLVPAQAAPVQPPDAVITVIMDRLNQNLRELEQGESSAPGATLELFRRELLPHVDTVTIARYVSAPLWTQAGTAAQTRFVAALEDYLLSTYSLLLTYGAQSGIEVNGDPDIRADSAIVSGHLRAQRQASLHFRFRLLKRNDSWKLFDVTTNGVSFIKTLRAQFRAGDSSTELGELTASLLEQAANSLR